MEKIGKRSEDLTGKKFGKWTVIGFNRGGQHGAYWNVRCECNARHVVGAGSLKRGGSLSCRACTKWRDRDDVVIALWRAGFSNARISQELRMSMLSVDAIIRKARVQKAPSTNA